MTKILVVGTHATDDPTLATLPFITAIGAVGGGKDVSIALLAEAAYLAKKIVANSVHGVGFAPLPELIEKVVAAKVPVYV
jgi:predicted peroxiredoxin